MYTKVVESIQAVGKATGKAKETVSEAVGWAAKKAQELPGTAQKVVGPILDKAPEELSKTAKVASRTIKTAVDGASSAIVPHWEWAKRELERRRK